jgi:hypothetical protein
MDRGDAVRTMRTGDRQIGHADFPLTSLLDQAHPLDPAFIARKSAPHLIDKTPVYLEDNLQLSWQ